MRRLLLGLVGGLLLMENIRLHREVPRDGAEAVRAVLPQLRWLDRQLDQGAAEEMQQLFPEGFLFTYALTGLARAELSLQNPDDAALRAEALASAQRALAAVRSEDGRAPFSPSLNPPYGAFYAGWSTWLAGSVVALGGQDPGYAAACADIADAYSAADNPFLPSYPGQSWPVDSVVAMSALALCDAQLKQTHRGLILDWVRRARLRGDPQTGLLPHTADAATGAPTSGPRGSSLAMSLRFMHELDREWSAEQYAGFQQLFVTRRAALPGVLEHIGGGGAGDIDAGPLVLGVSLSASAVAMGPARLHGDWALADDLRGAGEALGLPIELAGQRRYAFGILPVGDAFGAWSLTARPRVQEPTRATPTQLGGWRWVWHLASLALFGVLSLLGRPQNTSRRPKVFVPR